MSNNRTVEELKDVFDAKINRIRRDLDVALHETETRIRREYAVSIAVTLRSMFCEDSSGGTPLIRSSNIERHILFPHQAGPQALNLLPYFGNLGLNINNDKGIISFDGQYTHPNCFLSSFDWLYEIVVDFMRKDFPPLSRNDIIKTVADKEGAHYDPAIEKNIYLIENTNVASVQVVYKEKDIDIDCSNLFTEMILSIATDLIYAYDGFCNVGVKTLNLSNSKLYKYDFSDYNVKKLKYRFKYLVISKTAKINAYNPNPHFNCDVTEHVLHDYLIIQKNIQGRPRGNGIIIDTNGILIIE